ncbi:MAG: peptidoglycan -binding protein [Rhodospirillaceae bacterium]|nr:peptidoglycan -binding protein [Rhodospirillaceae bacterium]
MAAFARRARRTVDIWPGWVDALSTLLIIIIFVLLVFVVGQFYLGQALTGRDQALASLNKQVAQIGDMLNLERKARADLELTIGRLSSDLQSANQQMEILGQVRSDNADLTARLQDKTTESAKLQSSLAAAAQIAERDRQAIAKQTQELAALHQSVRAIEALKAGLEKQVAELGAKAARSDGDIAKERALTAEAQAQAALMSQQLEDLRLELERLSATLDASDRLTAEQKAQISDLGRRMNRALAGKVQELQRYRSEFFGRLRDILGARPGVTVVGDRFVFQSEVLFASGSADLGLDGQRQLTQLASTLLDISKDIPPELNWILRIDGHTDTVPIATALFRSNWELSAARAISVVKFLATQGVPAERLAAAGFGEFQPIESGASGSARSRNRRIELKLDQR